MKNTIFAKILNKGFAFAFVFMGSTAIAEPSHGIAMYGEPAMHADFVSLPYVNPDAPKGGRIVTANTGGFDSLNPYIRKGTSPWQLRFFAVESLMGRNRDEPFALYGLLAESIETGPNREWVEFTLRPEAKFSDGSPVTVEDVIWSFETLGTVGHPRYFGFWKKIDKIEQTGDRKVRMSFNVDDRELALIAGLRPILKKGQWEGRDINDSTLQDIPITSSPYMITDFEAGRFVTLTRNPDYWGKDLPLRRGTNNFDTIQIEHFGDGDVLFEAFKAGEVSFVREFNAENWATRYNFPRAQAGDVVQSEIPHQKPSGITGFVMNTRRAPFDDIRVRDALTHAFNFEFINEAMTKGRQPRITSYFSNSVLSKQDGPATGRVAEFLAPYADSVPAGTIEGYALPVSDGSERNRANIAKAMDLLMDAGFSVDNGVMTKPDGAPFTFEILMKQSGSGFQDASAVADIYVKALERLGIAAKVVTIDNAQYKERETAFDFDMTYYRRSLSLSPGNEQNLYWGSAAADTEGSRNWMGVKSAAIDGLINEMLTAESQDDFVAATRALDRVLTAGRYVIPFWNFAVGRIAHDKEMRFSSDFPIYGDGVDWMPVTWWYEE
jgi:peptide/nickel transport system substrate-binding protein